MAHITFIHGIANKPDSDNLLSLWKSNLADGGLDLDAYSVGSSMVYWADVVYADPAESSNEFESVESELGTAAEDDSLAWLSDLPNDQKAFAESLITRWGLDVPAPGGNERVSPDQLPDEESSYSFEAIPLPWFIKKRVIKRLLKDVHHYLFNETFSPREGDTYQVQTEIRNRFVEQLIKDKNSTEGKHVVVAHSMGTVISYDCLKNVQRCPSIDGYMTLGSPLGLSEIHDNFSPAYKKSKSFPSEKVNGGWVNIYDRLDPVAFDARIANDYKKNGEEVVVDERVRNSGVWRHSADKYFSQEALCEHLRVLLDL